MKLKYLLLLFPLVFIQPAFAQKSASVIVKNAERQAAVQNKDIFLIFHASWCGWCKRMDKEMNAPATKAFFNHHFVIKHITVLETKANKGLENPGGMKLLTKYNGQKAGLPFWIILDQDGKLLADSFDASGSNLGCPATKKEVAAFIHKLKQATNITKNQQEIIADAFVLNPSAGSG